MTQALDATKVQAFAGQMMSILNHGMLSLMVSIGHRTGLFDKMATLGPSTAAEIAGATSLQERYVREWRDPRARRRGVRVGRGASAIVAGQHPERWNSANDRGLRREHSMVIGCVAPFAIDSENSELYETTRGES